ncbi:MAG: class I SAM-dependent methyltransferase [Eubacterium sp.]|nr:class I SAM-dependent methyltransferase [Eubacterium sp.]
MYEGFANVYDQVMDNIPYEEWFEKLHSYLREHGIAEGSICELGCGTGTMTELFAGAGYHMIGIDVSPEMLALANMKREESGADILYLEQAMEEMELTDPVDAMISVCDSVNYLLHEEQLASLFAGVKRYLRPGGYLIFDVKTAYCYQQIIGNQTWVEQDDDVSYIWENYFYDDREINEYMLTIFRRREDGLFEKSEEAHYQRAYEFSLLREKIEQSGLEFVEAFGSDMHSEPGEMDERIYIVCKA